MSISDFERLLDTLLRREGRTTLTLTETPASADELLRLLERAVVVGNRRGAPLVEIHAPLDQYPHAPSSYWHVPVEDSSREGVVRLAFDRPALSDAA